MLEHFESDEIQTGETTLFVRWAGSGPPLLLLHGFPETHLMWRDIAPLLTEQFTIVCADLRGYGRSGCPASSADHLPYAKRTMALDALAVMQHLGFSRFSVAGHDRGGRVAYRMALDHPGRIQRLAVLDILPTETVWERADARFALSYWPWSLLAQPAPLPERLLGRAPEAVVADALEAWGSSPEAFGPEIRAAYVDALSDPAHIQAICEEYRAGATIDRAHDDADRKTGRRIDCPVLVLWSGRGALHQWYAADGGPLALWSEWAAQVQGRAVDGGHFFPEELPEETAGELGQFF